jgi:hypothetical protein
MTNQTQNPQIKKNFMITKKIAKHGTQSIIVIPRMLEYHLPPGTIVELNINVIENKAKEKD